MNQKKFRNLYIKLTAPITFIRYFKDAIGVSKEESYFPERKRKSLFRRVVENLIWLIRYHEVNDFYNLYGFDIQNFRNQKEYIDNYSFYLSRNDANNIKSPESKTCILRDKLLFYEFMHWKGFSVPKVFALIENGKICNLKRNELKDSFFKDKKNYFIKEKNGECASFVKYIHDYDDYLKLKLQLKGEYIVQEAVSQCSKMNELNPNAINTLRVVTVYSNGKVEHLSSVLRVGTKKCGDVDNWAAGGLAIGIYPDGRLKMYGMHKPCHGRKKEKHPDTNIEFKDFVVPQYEDAIKLCIKAHSFLKDIHSIGWDIAICEDGPCIIEGNDNWEISLMQACDKPLKKKWENLL